MDLSVVVPAYDEAASLPELVSRVRAALEPLQLDWELVVVDDGSADGTFEVVRRLRTSDDRVHGLRLSRNFGQQLALLAGLQAARGRAVVTIDADLQYPPELLPELLERWRAGAAIVNTVCSDADAGLPTFKRLTSRLFYRLFSALSGLELRPGTADYRLFDRRVVDVLVASADHRPFLRGFAAWVGFEQVDVPFVLGPRRHGRSRYTLGKMLRLAVGGVVGFSAAPLYASLLLGVMGLAGSLGLGGWAALSAGPGWRWALVLASALMSLQFVALGVLGAYVGEIARAVSARPSVVIADSTLVGAAPTLQAVPRAEPGGARRTV